MRNKLLLICALFCMQAMQLHAEDYDIYPGDTLKVYSLNEDGINLRYWLRRRTKDAVLIEVPKDYRGCVRIPEKVEYGDATYPVTKIGGEYDVWRHTSYVFHESEAESVELPSSLKIIGQSSIWHTKRLKRLVIPNSVTEIEKNGIYHNDSLESVVISNSIEVLSYRALGDNLQLSSVTFADGSILKEIIGHAFYNCQSLKEICLPDKVEKIGMYAFENCTSLSSLKLPESLVTIQYQAFLNTGLTSLFIPRNVTDMPEPICVNCPMLETLEVSKDNPVFDSRNNCNAIIDTYQNKLFNGINKTVIPDDVTSIGNRAYEKIDVEEIYIPENITEIGDYAFASSKIRRIALPASIRKLGKYSFYDCDELESITIPDGVEEIPKGAISACDNLKTIVLGPSVNAIAQDALASKSLENLYLTPVEPPSVDNYYNPFGKYDSSFKGKLKVFVPIEGYTRYKSHSYWGKFVSLDDPTSINDITSGTDDNKVYDVNGIECNGQPQHGLYIKNGRKILVK